MGFLLAKLGIFFRKPSRNLGFLTATTFYIKSPHIFSAIEIFQYPGGNWYGKRKKQNKETNRHRG